MLLPRRPYLELASTHGRLHATLSLQISYTGSQFRVILHVAEHDREAERLSSRSHRSQMVQQDLLPASSASGEAGALHSRRP